MREVSLALLDIAQNAVDAGAKHIGIYVGFDGRGLEFEVRDDGAGMDEVMLASVAHKGVSYKGSTGLGLAFLKEETQSMGGKAEIISEKNVGSTVRATYFGSPSEVVLGNLGETYVALADGGYDLTLNINAFGVKKSYDTSGLKSSSDTANLLESYRMLRLIREDINKFIRQNGGAML